MAYRNKSVSAHQFAMVPKADIPRSSFRMQTSHKTTVDSGFLIPVYCEEVLPGDSFNLKMTAFGRLATPIFPFMDNVYLDSFFFFVPNRLVWDNWQKFMGEQVDPGDSIDYLVPQIVSPVGGYPALSIYDYFGLPTVGQVDAAGTVSHSALPLRAYATVWNAWFRDENLQDSIVVSRGDGPDLSTAYTLQRRGKRHDYFTSGLPWPQKGESVSLPLGSSAPVLTSDTRQASGAHFSLKMAQAQDGAYPSTDINLMSSGTNSGDVGWSGAGGSILGGLYPTNLYADLSAATAATINQLRQSFQIQKLLERDARGGTRYTEMIRAHFGVLSPDARLQRPEYLGGGTTMVSVKAVPQTSGTPTQSGGYTPTPQGNLAATGTLLAPNHGFSQSFTEHGYVIGLVSIRADLTYQQGLRRTWSRRTRYDYYFPVFSHLGEQTILQKEIYCLGIPQEDDKVFAYQERHAEYRYHPAMVTGLMRSTSTGTIDAWHLAQRFSSPPVLDSTFIQENPPIQRVVAVGAAALGQEFLLDTFFDIRAARPMPMYSVPGLIDHF